MHKLLITLMIGFILLPGISYAGESRDTEKDSTRSYTTPSITVTTTRAVEGKNPVPFAELSRSQLENTYINRDVPELLTGLPSVVSYSQNGNDIGYSSLTMRGFDQRRISVMINGIPQNDPEDHQVYWIDFPDLASNLDNIQVQRGAGIISYGAAAIGGSINLTTTNFVNKRGVSIYSGIGYQEYGSSGQDVFQPTMNKLSFEVSSGLINDKYAFYGRLSKINSDGYRDRSWAYMNSYFLSGVRFDKNFTTQFNVFGGPINDGLAYTGLPKSYISDLNLRRKNPSFWVYGPSGDTVSEFYDRRPQEVEEFSQPHFELLNDWFINDNLTFKSSAFYYTGKGYFDYDGSWADTTMLRLTAENGYPNAQNPANTIIRAWVSNKQGGWIPRLIWKHGENKQHELTAGAEVRIHRSEHWGQIHYAENLPLGFNPDYNFYFNNGERDIFSVFGRERLQLNKKLNLSLETQVVRHSYRISNEMAGNVSLVYNDINGNKAGGGGKTLFDVNYLFVNPRIGAIYKPADNMNIYGLAAYTSREPRMRNLYAADDAFFGAKPLFRGQIIDGSEYYDFNNPIVKPERMLDYELGFTWRTQKYYLNANLYWMEYRDELVKSGQVDIFGNPVDGNADQTRHYGIELSAAADIISGSAGKLNISANATFSSNKIIKYNFITSDNKIVSLDGNAIAGFPDEMANVNINYFFGNLFASLTGRFVGSMRTDNFGDLIKTNQDLITNMRNDFNSGYYNDNILDAYYVFDLNLSYTFKDVVMMQGIRLQAQVRNLLNRLYAAGAEGKDFFPAAERSFFFGAEFIF